MNAIAGMFARWLTRRRNRSLRKQLVKKRDAASLQTWLTHLIDHELSMGIEDEKLREALFGMTKWEVPGGPGDFLFAGTEHYLAENCRADRKTEWQSWVRLCRLAGRRIEVTGPRLTKALRTAQEQGVLDALPLEDRQYLLTLYRDAYAWILSNEEDPSAPDQLPLLLSYASMLHDVGSDEAAKKFLARLSGRFQSRPRSLGAMNDEEALACPECGVGSPHRIGVTIYHDSSAGGPVRITGAGTTADATLTARVFTNVFAAALACDGEPTLVTTAGWSLSLLPNAATRTGDGSAVLSAVLTPAGPGEPMAGTPTMGMTPPEALSIIADSFERAQEATGLVRVMRWESRDAAFIEERIVSAFNECRSGMRVLKSEPRHTEGSSVIHVMPLLHRNSKGEVVPVEIDLPYESLGPRRVFDLLRRGRSTYMNQLISAAQSREAYARQAKIDQGEAIKHWSALSPEAKEAFCKKNPTVTITMAYNWDLGVTVPLAAPEEVPRVVYEEQDRPQIRESAARKEQEFAAIADKLKTMNQPGGRADILTFKLLVDSMIRRAEVAIPDEEFQEEYRRWVDISSPPTWAAIAAWAGRRGLPVESLAADNICFNAHVDPRNRGVRLQPMVMLDLHDFVVRVDGDRGTMEAFPSGKTATLNDCLAPDKAARITTPADLHGRFVKWMAQRVPVESLRREQQQTLASGMLADRRIGTAIRMAQAKRALFRGDAEEAMKIIADIRRSDNAAIYFWGAVADQYRHLCDLPITGLPAAGAERCERLMNFAIGVLIENLKADPKILPPGAGAKKPVGSPQALAQAAHIRSLITPQARSYLGQLSSCDPSFTAGLVSERPDIAQMERACFAFTEKDEDKFHAAVMALSALELLDLAEAIKNMARALPFSHRLTAELREEIRELVRRKESLTLAPAPESLELDDLQKML